MKETMEHHGNWLIRLMGLLLLSMGLGGFIIALLALSGGEYIFALFGSLLSFLLLLCSLPLIYFGNLKTASKFIDAILENFRAPI